jgi:hypothetical protein
MRLPPLFVKVNETDDLGIIVAADAIADVGNHARSEKLMGGVQLLRVYVG